MATARLATTERVKVTMSLQEAAALRMLLGQVSDRTDEKLNELTTGLFWALVEVLEKASFDDYVAENGGWDDTDTHLALVPDDITEG